MALQGTLETFALPDVLRLLASTKKTGCYRLDGDRGSGRLWVRDGQIVSGDISGSPAVTDPAEVAFELLRFRDGEFLFQADAAAPQEGDPEGVEVVLAAADEMLVEWRDIEAVIPSLATWVGLRAELPADEVTIRADKWVSVVAIGGGSTVGQLGGVLGLGELPVSRIVKELLELGIIELHETAEAGAAAGYGQQAYAEPAYDQGYAEPGYDQGYSEPGYSEPGYEQGGYEQQPSYEQAYEQPSYERAAYDNGGYDDAAYGEAGYNEAGYEPSYDPAYQAGDTTSLDSSSLGYGYDDLTPLGSDGNVLEFSPYGEGNDQFQTFDSGAGDYGADRYADAPPPPSAPAPAARSGNGDTDPTDAAEIARQLANLSPKAAKAVAAAAKATTQAEREAALAQVDETQDPINRDLLLKFLGSVNS